MRVSVCLHVCGCVCSQESFGQAGLDAPSAHVQTKHHAAWCVHRVQWSTVTPDEGVPTESSPSTSASKGRSKIDQRKTCTHAHTCMHTHTHTHTNTRAHTHTHTHTHTERERERESEREKDGKS